MVEEDAFDIPLLSRRGNYGSTKNTATCYRVILLQLYPSYRTYSCPRHSQTELREAIEHPHSRTIDMNDV